MLGHHRAESASSEIDDPLGIELPGYAPAVDVTTRSKVTCKEKSKLSLFCCLQHEDEPGTVAAAQGRV